MKNPFVLSFGKKPLQYVSRLNQINTILDTFCDEPATNQVYMITGVRGSGKTVMLSNIADEFRKDENWIVVDLNPGKDLLNALVAKLYSVPELKKLFLKAKLDFSALGLGVSVENAISIVDEESALERMMAQIKKDGKKLLIAIDEAVNNKHIEVFAGTFQMLIRQDAPIYLIMTGLYENIYDIQNNKMLTFLYRAPKIVLEPLNLTAVTKQYQEVFNISREKAESMAILTKGYPFAFQVLGYLYWDNKDKSLEQILPEYDRYMDEFVYSKIWSEMSELDKKVARAIAESDDDKVQTVRESVGMTSLQFNVYRDRLKRKGIVDTRTFGRISLVLPRFAEYINEMVED